MCTNIYMYIYLYVYTHRYIYTYLYISMCIYTLPLALLPHSVPSQGPPLARSVAPGRCIVPISNFGQLLAKESVETWFCSPAPVRHRAVCASVRNRTTGAACAPRPLALIPHGTPPHGPPVARSFEPRLDSVGCPDSHPSPLLRRWLYWSPPFPLRTDPQLPR